MVVRSLLLVLSCLALRAHAAVNEWTPLGPAGADVHAVAVSPASSATVAVGTSTGYAFTRNGGASWDSVTTGYETSAIHFDASDPSIVLAGTSAAIARSTDGGATFTPVLLDGATCLAADPTAPAVLYAGSVDHVYKSLDRGVTWAPVYTGPGHSFVKAIAVDPSSPQTVWAAMTFGGVQRSTNGGGSWTAVSGGVPMSVSGIAVHPTSPATVLLLGSNGVYRTTNGGSTWGMVTSLFGSNGALVADRAAPGTFWAAGSDGVALSVDGGATWNRLNGGLTNTVVQSLAIDPSDRTRVFAGTQGSGLFEMTVGSGGSPTIRLTSPNGGETLQAGSVFPITWTSTGGISAVKLEYSTTSPWNGELVDPVTIAASVPNTGSYPWTVPFALSAVCHVRVGDVAGTVSDVSDGPFQITSCGFIGLVPPFSQSFGAAGGSGTIEVHTTSGCAWTATSESPWITVTSGSSGNGSGSVTYSVAPNPAGVPREGTLRIGGQAFTVEQAAGVPGAEVVVFVPVVLDVFGAGTSHYTSELTLTNRSGSAATVSLSYVGAASLGGGSGTATVYLPPGRQVVEPDAIGYLRSLDVPIPASGGRAGTLRVGFSGVASPSEVAATVRTTTAVANGQAGLAYAGVPSWKLLTGPSYICGLRENGSDRSNLALQNAGGPADGSVMLRVTVCSGSTAARVVRPDLTLAPGAFLQVSGILAEHGMSNGYVKVERVGGAAPYYAYGVVNDQVNSDGSFVPPLAASTAAVTGLIVPVVLEASVYTSELVVTNWSETPRSLRLAFVSDQVDRPDRTATATLPVAAGAQVILPNVFQYFRDQGAAGIGPAGSGYVGALFLTAESGSLAGIAAGVRTSSPGGGGRYGLFYPATPAGSSTGVAVWLYGLQQNATNRTNLAIVNTGEAGDGADVFAIDVWDGETGLLAHTETGIVLQAKRWMQVNAFLEKYAPGVGHGWARVRRVSGTNPFIAYAVVNDGGVPQQRSDDGAFLAASED